MNAAIVTLPAVLLAYLLGSIPFGLLVARWFGKVDIRTVGSGNIGATNVGRVLGFRFFVVVFLLDFAKGFLPTWYLPRLAKEATGLTMSDLAVLVAVAAILGHNFPVFLKFRGGKGVATSLGSVFALDAFASGCAATGFAAFLLLTRYVSMSSILAGLVWLIAHFARVGAPMARDQVAMTIASIGLMALLVARHRANLVRIGAGTEPKLNLRKKKPRPPAGKVVPILVGLLALAGLAVGFALNAGRKFEVVAGPYWIREVARVATGHQRAERLAFADRGRLLIATCPRYGRVMLYRIDGSGGLALLRDVETAGRPFAIAATPDRIVVLIRPNNDARHVEQGWIETLDLEGKPIGGRTLVGFYPDDLVVTPDGRHALVLTSGRGEGGEHRPRPTLASYDLGATGGPKLEGQLAFDRPGDDPARLALAADGKLAAVSLQGTRSVAWVDLAEIGAPRLKARSELPKQANPDALRFDSSGALVIVDESTGTLLRQTGPNATFESLGQDEGIGEAVEIPGKPAWRAASIPFESGIRFAGANPESHTSPAFLPLKGRANLASTRPLGLAYEPTRGLLAVGNRSGGSLHLIRLDRGEATR